MWQALAYASGAQRARPGTWRAEMLACLAQMEAVIDLGDSKGFL